MENIEIYDSPNDIAKCLSCEKDFCDNCLFTGRNRYDESDMDYVRNHDLTNLEFAKYFGIDVDKVYELKKKAGQSTVKPIWTNEELTFLLTHSLDESAVVLKRSREACYLKRYQLMKEKV